MNKNDLKLDGLSKNLELSNQEKLKSVFPECFAEGKLDIDKLLALCGEYIDNDFETYKFQWKGKAESLKLAQQQSNGTLRPVREDSVNFDTTKNVYIEGDNLEVLKLLQSSYFGQVKMIYIDPPYNTGNDFVYKDDYRDPLRKYKEITSQTTKSNPETMGRFHTEWLNMMYPRLRLAANLLTDDGVIFISIDDHEVDNLKKLCNEVFGEENFVAQIVWQKRTSPDARRTLSTGHEYILSYTKNILLSQNVFKTLPLTEKDKEVYKNPDNDPNGPWVSTDCTAQAGHGTKNQFYSLTTPAGRVVELPDSLCWRFTKDKMNEEISKGRIWFGKDGNGVPRKKTYLNERTGKNLWSWWPNTEVGHTQSATQELTKLLGGKLFDFSKPTQVIRRCLEISTNNDSLILDFFSGSATTAQAVMELNAIDGGNRKYICVQLPELTEEKTEAYKAGYKNICEIGKERIRRAGEKLTNDFLQNGKMFRDLQNSNGKAVAHWIDSDEYKEECKKIAEELDIGFKVFRLDETNFNPWDSSPVPNQEEYQQRLLAMGDSIKEGRSIWDVVYEISLKMGLPLDSPISSLKINDKTAFVVDDLLLLICMEENITTEDVIAMADHAPGKIVLGEHCFMDDSALSNGFYVLKDREIDLKLV